MPELAVVSLSGGMDSAVALAEARAAGFAPHAVSFDYGQRHRVELDAAARVVDVNDALTPLGVQIPDSAWLSLPVALQGSPLNERALLSARW